MKKDIVVNFPKQEKFDTLRSNQGARRLTRGFAKPAAGSTNTKKGSAGANWDYIHLNSKYGPMSTKLER